MKARRAPPVNARVDAYMRFFPADWLEATADLSLEEQGAYMRIIAHMWKRHGSIPFDADRLARLCGVDTSTWARIWKSTGELFTVDQAAGVMTQSRVTKEIEIARARSQKGRAASAGRWGKSSTQDAQISLRGMSAHPDPDVPAPKEPAYPSEFDRVWEETGRVGNKLPSFRAWKKQGCPAADLVIAGWRRAEAHDRRWQGTDPHIPHLSTWLHARGWEDDASQSRRNGSPVVAPRTAQTVAAMQEFVSAHTKGAT